MKKTKSNPDKKTEFLLNVLTQIKNQIEGSGVHYSAGKNQLYDRERAFDVCKIICENLKAKGIQCETSADNIRLKYPEHIGLGGFSLCLNAVAEVYNELKAVLGYDPKRHYYGDYDGTRPKMLAHIGFKYRPLLKQAA